MEHLFKSFNKLCLHNAILFKSFHTTNPVNYANRGGQVMKKLMGFSSKKKRNYTDTPLLPTPTVFSKGANEGKQSGNSRRASVLNKTFMRYITDLMATGEYSSEIVGHGIEVNKVKVTPDYKILRVYWIAKGTADDAVVEKLLHKNAGFLRHELSQLRVMGQVPKIEFIKDKQYAVFAELDARLAVADFGEDHVPIEPAAKLKTQLELYTDLDDNLKQKISELETSENIEYEEELPPMPQNVLGLNHADIMARIQKSMKQSIAIHRLSNIEEDENVPSSDVNESPAQYSRERMAFREFLVKRQVLRKKEKSGDKNVTPDLELIREEFKERHLKFLDNIDIMHHVEEDYIIEDENDDKCK